jgi:uncharacterized membrane protein
MKPAIAVPAIGALVYRAYSRKSLTPLGIATAFLTAVAHAIHPYSVCFALLAVFFLLGTAVTKVRFPNSIWNLKKNGERNEVDIHIHRSNTTSKPP